MVGAYKLREEEEMQWYIQFDIKKCKSNTPYQEELNWDRCLKLLLPLNFRLTTNTDLTLEEAN